MPVTIFTPVSDTAEPPTTATVRTEVHPFRVWVWDCFSNGWFCVAMFVQRADAREFIKHETGRAHDIYLQSPAGVERFTSDMR